MWGGARTGESATAASMTTKIARSVDAEIKGAVLSVDCTEWNDLLTAANPATAEYVKNTKPATASLLRLRALMKLDSVVVTARGPSYPFVFGTKKTNGLTSAVRFALENVGGALYAEGTGRRVCLSVAPRHGTLSDLLHILNDLDAVVIERDACMRYETYVGVLGRAKVACIDAALVADCLRLVRLAYHEAFVAGSELSELLQRTLLETCRTGVASSRVAQLVLKKIDLDVLKIVETHDTTRQETVEHEENADVLSRMHVALKRLNCSNTLEFK